MAKSDTHFLNADVIIRSKADLSALVAALGKKLVVLYAGRIKRTYHVRLELAGIARTPDSTIRRLCALIEALPKTERNLWNDALDRTLDIGMQAGKLPLAAEFALEAGTVNAVSALGARIVVTIYGLKR